MSRIIITADSTFDMQPQTAEALDIKVIPSYVRMGEGDLPDYPDVTMFDLFEYHDKSGKLPQTSAASPWIIQSFSSSSKAMTSISYISPRARRCPAAETMPRLRYSR